MKKLQNAFRVGSDCVKIHELPLAEASGNSSRQMPTNLLFFAAYF